MGIFVCWAHAKFLEEILFIAISALAPILIGRLITKTSFPKPKDETLSKPLLSGSSAWVLCLPVLMMILGVSLVFNNHFQDRYPAIVFCPFIFVSMSVFLISLRNGSKENFYYWLRVICFIPIILAIAALELPETYNNRGALLILAAYFQGFVFGMLLLKKFKRF